MGREPEKDFPFSGYEKLIPKGLCYALWYDESFNIIPVFRPPERGKCPSILVAMGLFPR